MRIEARVPASVANLGPGFDCLGMAVDLFQLRLCLVPGGDSKIINAHGTNMDRIAAKPDNLVCRALHTAFDHAGYRLPCGYRLEIDNEIPMARGLGSSAAAIVGGLLLAREWLAAEYNCGLTTSDLVELAVQLEGHGDNVVAAMMGGVTVAVKGENRLYWQRIGATEYPSLVLAIPESWQTTASARRLLPASVPYGDAVYNSAHVALLVAALAGGNYGLLGEAMRDRLHEPYREEIYPWLSAVRAAALEAGAYGVSLSGAGPSMVAFVPDDSVGTVMNAMETAYLENGHEAHVYRASVAGGAVVRTASDDSGTALWSGVDESMSHGAGSGVRI